jgi:hypothetical protein
MEKSFRNHIAERLKEQVWRRDIPALLKICQDVEEQQVKEQKRIVKLQLPIKYSARDINRRYREGTLMLNLKCCKCNNAITKGDTSLFFLGYDVPQCFPCSIMNEDF